LSSQTEEAAPSKHQVEEIEEVVIRFAGDSGDGMQLTGTQFADTTALVGNDLARDPRPGRHACRSQRLSDPFRVA
jgi:hypothetical protein